MNKKMKTGYAVVEIAGKQFRVTAGQELKIPHTGGEAGDNVQLKRVLLLNDGSATHFGDPTIASASIDATIIGHGRDRKIFVFKFRRRKGYRKKAGHRQGYSMLRINDINLGESKPPVKAGERPTEATVETTGEAAEKSAAPKKPSTAGKTAAPKKTATTKKSAGTTKGTASKSAVKKKAGG